MTNLDSAVRKCHSVLPVSGLAVVGDLVRVVVPVRLILHGITELVYLLILRVLSGGSRSLF